MNYNVEWMWKVLDKEMNSAEFRLAKIYQQTAKNIKSELSDLFERFGQSGQLTYAEMQKYNRLNNLLTSVNSEISNSFKGITSEFKGLITDMYSESYYMQGFMISQSAGLNLSFGLIPTGAIKSLIQDANISGLSLLEM